MSPLVPLNLQLPGIAQRRLVMRRNHRRRAVRIIWFTPQLSRWLTKTWKPATYRFLYQTTAMLRLINLALLLSKPGSYPLSIQQQLFLACLNLLS